MPENRLSYLLNQYFSRQSTVSERQELAELIAEVDDENLKAELEELWVSYNPHADISEERTNVILNSILSSETVKYEAPVYRIPVVRRAWFRYVAAASIILICGIGTYFLINKNQFGDNSVVINDQQPEKDVLPGTNHAVLILSNSQKIILDSTGNGTIAKQGSANVIKQSDGQITYDIFGNNKELVYNTLSNPRGRQIC